LNIKGREGFKRQKNSTRGETRSAGAKRNIKPEGGREKGSGIEKTWKEKTRRSKVEKGRKNGCLLKKFPGGGEGGGKRGEGLKRFGKKEVETQIKIKRGP